jgi:hypothetical protein
MSLANVNVAFSALPEPPRNEQLHTARSGKLKLDLIFENLTDKLQRVFKTLLGQGTLTEENIAEALREIRVALL